MVAKRTTFPRLLAARYAHVMTEFLGRSLKLGKGTCVSFPFLTGMQDKTNMWDGRATRQQEPGLWLASRSTSSPAHFYTVREINFSYLSHHYFGSLSHAAEFIVEDRSLQTKF